MLILNHGGKGMELFWNKQTNVKLFLIRVSFCVPRKHELEEQRGQRDACISIAES